MLVLLVFVVWLHTGGDPVVRAIPAESMEVCQKAVGQLTAVAAANNDQLDARCLVVGVGTPT